MAETKALHRKKVLTPILRYKGFTDPWREVTIGAIAEIVGGGTPETTIDDYWGGNIQWFTPTELKSKYISKSKRTITELGLKNSSAKLLPKGTLLFSSRATIGDVSIALQEVTTNQGFQSLIVNKSNEREFLYNWIIQNKKSFLRKAAGSTFLEISKKEIEKIKINIPSLPEQQKIAAFFGMVDEKIQLLNRKKELLEHYKKGLMQQLFSGKLRFKNEKGKDYPKWEEKKLGQLIEFINGKGHEQAIDENGEYVVVNSKFISTNGSVRKYCKSQISPLNKGDIVLVMSDVPNGKALAKCYLIEQDNLYTLNQRICALKQKHGVNQFLIYLINRNAYYLSFDSGVGQTNLKKEDVLNCPLTVPSSLEEQKKIADYLSALDKKLEQLNQQITQTQNFKKGLLQQMFV